MPADASDLNLFLNPVSHLSYWQSLDHVHAALKPLHFGNTVGISIKVTAAS